MADNYHHQDSSGFTAGLLIGLIIGGAGGYLLSSEKGQELLDSLKENGAEKLKDLMDNPLIADKLRDLESTMAVARATLSNSAGQAQKSVHDAAERLAEATAPPKEPKKNFFKRMGASLGK
jgi:gas vesicle protein